MSALATLRSLFAHPAPGLLFAAHSRAGVGERAFSSPHRAEPPPPADQAAALVALCAANPLAHADLIEFYLAHNGAELCLLWHDDGETEEAALTLLPISYWDGITSEWSTGHLRDFMSGCDMYTHGTWRVIAQMPSEGMCLTYFFDGEHEGESLACRMCCIGLDGYLGFEETLAMGFGAFASEFSRDPAAFFNRIGFCCGVSGNGGNFGDPVDLYLPDVHAHPSLRPGRARI
jgi:hypothetical protein